MIIIKDQNKEHHPSFWLVTYWVKAFVTPLVERWFELELVENHLCHLVTRSIWSFWCLWKTAMFLISKPEIFYQHFLIHRAVYSIANASVVCVNNLIQVCFWVCWLFVIAVVVFYWSIFWHPLYLNFCVFKPTLELCIHQIQDGNIFDNVNVALTDIIYIENP